MSESSRSSFLYMDNNNMHTQPQIESNKEAVMEALKLLQARIYQLEHDRNQSQERIHSPKYEYGASVSTIGKDGKKLETQLHSVSDRCRLLEQQLQDMRRTMDDVQKKSELNKQYQFEVDESFHSSNDDVEIPSREPLQYRNSAPDHIRVVKHKSDDDKPMVYTCEEPIEIGRIESKAKKQNAKKSKSLHHKKPKHYHLDMPFITGTSTTDSHSLPANLQKVLSLMKCHSNTLCKSSQTNVNGNSTTSNNLSDLDNLLSQLKEEFATISYQHETLSAKILKTNDIYEERQLEKQADQLLNQMEKKAEQIAKLRAYQNKRENKTNEGCKKKTIGNFTIENPTTVQVTTTVSTSKSTEAKSKQCLKGLKKIQEKLTKNDIGWM